MNHDFKQQYEREFWEPCQTKEELWNWLQLFINLNLPNQTVDPHSNSNPFDFVWEVYHAMLTGEGAGRQVVAAGRNVAKCLKEGTLVSTPKGPVEIQNLKPGDTVYDEYYKKVKVTAVWDQGEQDCIDILKDGEVVATCTKNHKFVVYSPTWGGNFWKDRYVKPVDEMLDKDRFIFLNTTGEGFSIRKKGSGLTPLYSKHITKIRPAGRYRCWDITVDSPTSLYRLESGLITHNTLSSALLHFLSLVHFRKDCLQLAAAKYQSEKCIEYVDKWLKIDVLKPYANIDNKGRKTLSGMPPNSYTDRDEASLVVTVATMQGVNAFRASLLVLDELDLVDPKIIAEAAAIGDPDSRGRNPIFVYLSSRKTAAGPIQELVDEALSPNAEDIKLHLWSVADFIKPCPPEVHKPEGPKQKAWINKESAEIVWDTEPFDVDRQEYEHVVAHEGCRSCPAFLICRGFASNQKGTSRGLRDIQFIQRLIKATKDPKRIISQLLNWKPETAGSVYSSFNTFRHLKSLSDSYIFITGKYFNPGNHSPDHYQKILESNDPEELRKITPTKLDIYNAMKRNGWHVVWGIDWGYHPDPAVFVAVGFHKKTQKACVLHVDKATGYANHDWAEFVCSRYLPLFPPDFVAPDMADAACPSYFSKYNLSVKDKKPSRIETGVSQIRGLLWNPSLQESTFCIIKDASNDFMVKEMQAYSHKKTPLGFDFTGFEDDNNHSLDALRYALDAFIDLREVRLASTQPKDYQQRMKELYNRAYYHNDPEAQKELVKLQIESNYKNQFGVTFDLSQMDIKPDDIVLTPKSESAQKLEDEIKNKKASTKSFSFKF